MTSTRGGVQAPGNAVAYARQARRSGGGGGGVRGSCSANGLLFHRCDVMRLRRSRSEPLLVRCSMRPRAAGAASQAPPMLGCERPAGFTPHQGDAFGTAADGGPKETVPGERSGAGGPHPPLHDDLRKGKRANWVQRLLELRRQWKDRRRRVVIYESAAGELGGGYEDKMEEYCAVSYGSSDEEGDGGGREEKSAEFGGPEAFSAILAGVPFEEIKLFSQLVFLCNAVYVLPQLKAEDLKNYYDLRWVTSSIDKKSKAAAIKEEKDAGSRTAASAPGTVGEPTPKYTESAAAAAAYGIAASAASYAHLRASREASRVRTTSGDERARVPGCEPAARVAASTMTTVIAAEAAARLEAALELRSLQSAPCEWLVCDEPDTCTRVFVIQGSDSLASWQANLFFEPTEFEGTAALAHRGIYEAAQGMYEQLVPEILSHLSRHGERARLRFTGHSLGGSLSLLLHLMVLTRGVVQPSALLPVVTFGSPFVLCGGGRVLSGLGLGEDQIRCVIMHRDIVPRAFSCSYPHHVAQLLKRLNRSFRSHPCLKKDKLLYSPLGKLYIIQPDEKSSPPHPLLPPGCAVYALGGGGATEAMLARAARAFLDSPHPLETLSQPAAYGSKGTILRDHGSSNYLRAVNEILRQHSRWVVKRSRDQRPLLTLTLRDHPWRPKVGC